MSQANASGSWVGNNKVLIIAVAVVVLIVILMYFWDQQQRRRLELHRLEARVGALEEWGLPRRDKKLNKGGVVEFSNTFSSRWSLACSLDVLAVEIVQV